MYFLNLRHPMELAVNLDLVKQIPERLNPYLILRHAQQRPPPKEQPRKPLHGVCTAAVQFFASPGDFSDSI